MPPSRAPGEKKGLGRRWLLLNIRKKKKKEGNEEGTRLGARSKKRMVVPFNHKAEGEER